MVDQDASMKCGWRVSYEGKSAGITFNGISKEMSIENNL